eukprot:CAMPEP_0114507662 /NCGR_PEP_ID=MMETSP0109-20121206/12139_1 /TAXON_ID=29199 /ORGANISM="Chlorarachnion reptans, Strain CCCM449" /LENGTH=141 /DNA_ID=CAMNT_0001686449 /DNA_START=887 /DNA_END=1310 /DNA_ORIENTATION=-
MSLLEDDEYAVGVELAPQKVRVSISSCADDDRGDGSCDGDYRDEENADADEEGFSPGGGGPADRWAPDPAPTAAMLSLSGSEMDSMMVPYGVRRHHFTSRSLLALLNNAPPPPPPPPPLSRRRGAGTLGAQAVLTGRGHQA